MIFMGVNVLLIGLLARITNVLTVGLIVLVIGSGLLVLGVAARTVGGRRHSYRAVFAP